MSSASGKWKHFERLVTAIHRIADQGAEVRWNETIRGRQFDVTIRFQYLTVVECKSYGDAISAEAVEALATKSSDVQAHHAVMASTSGFQEEAREVARRRNLTLIHMADSSDIDLVYGTCKEGNMDARCIECIELEYADGERKPLPKEPDAMVRYSNQILIQYGSEQGALSNLIQYHSQDFFTRAFSANNDYVIACPLGARVIGPDDGEIRLKPLARVHIRAGVTKATPLSAQVMFDPYLLVPNVKICKVVTGEEKTASANYLERCVNDTFVEGQFYEQPQLATYYFCEAVKNGLARLYLLESFQLGRILQAQITVKTECAKLYVPADKSVIERLQRRLGEIRARQTRN